MIEADCSPGSTPAAQKLCEIHCEDSGKEAFNLRLHGKRDMLGTNTGRKTHSSMGQGRGDLLLSERKESICRSSKASVHYQAPAGLYDNFYNLFIQNSGCYEG